MEHERKRRKPKRYTEKLGKEIADRIAAGESWSRMCLEGEMPSYTTRWAWAAKHPEFAERLEAARTMAADARADEALEVIRNGATPAQQANLLMMHAARLAPKRWSAKGVEAAAAAEQAPKRIVIVVRNFVPVTLPDGRVITREIRPDGSFIDEA